MISRLYKHALGRLLGAGLSSNVFSFPAGYSPVPTPARYYIDLFLNKHDSQIRGRCVEFMPPYYRDRYIYRPEVSSYDVWDVSPNDEATIVADLQSASAIPTQSFDTIIATHVLCNIAKPWLAAAEIHRLLAPKGLLLCTVPMVLQGHAPHPKDYWRFTPDTFEVLFSQFSRVETDLYGNAATSAGSLQYLMQWHYSHRVLNFHDPKCPSIVACAAWK